MNIAGERAYITLSLDRERAKAIGEALRYRMRNTTPEASEAVKAYLAEVVREIAQAEAALSVELEAA